MRWPFEALAISLLVFGIVHAMQRSQILALRENARQLFFHGFDNYMEHAFPEDELRPLSCKGQGSDKLNAGNVGRNDVCGDFALTLIDTLDAFPILGDQDTFEKAVRDVIDTVTFDVDSKVQIFEVTIRVLGGLLSAHQFATSTKMNSTIAWYDNELLTLAVDLGDRLLPAFDSPTGIPYPRINLRYGLGGLALAETTETCAAGAGTLVLEFAALSRLTGDPIYEKVAIRSFTAIWERRLELGLVGNTIDVKTGIWTTSSTSVGAGVDSFYEYALKAWIFTGNDYFYDVWNQSHAAISAHVADDENFLLRNVHVRTGFLVSNWIDSLSAYYAGLLVLAGFLEEAIKSHLIYHNLWTRFRAIPERFNFYSNQIEIPWYPLRPEFVESTYFLYQATKDPFYLAVGRQILEDLESFKVPCGFAGMGNVITRTLDDRMESFMLSETLKYLYLLFDTENPLNSLHSEWVFTTEGHPLIFDQPRAPQHRTFTEHLIKERCQNVKPANFFSSIVSRDDYSHAQLKTGLDFDVTPTPAYFPLAHPRSTTRSLPIQTDFDVLFGSVALSVKSASSSMIQIGKDLVIRSLLGLKIRFSRIGRSGKVLATKVGSMKLSNNAAVIIRDPNYRKFTTGDLVQFTSSDMAVLEVHSGDNGKQTHRMTSLVAVHGTALEDEFSMNIYSLLSTENSQGCSCPAILTKSTSNTTAVVVYRGRCTFFEKALNAAGAARLVIVVDNEAASEEAVRPVLVDAIGHPMPSDAAYPSLVMVQGSKAIYFEQGKTVKVRVTQKHDMKERLLINGDAIENVEIQTSE